MKPVVTDTQWFKCILCDAVMDQNHVSDHLTSKAHKDAAYVDFSGTLRYIFSVSPPNFSGPHTKVSTEFLVQEYKYRAGELVASPLGDQKLGTNVNFREEKLLSEEDTWSKIPSKVIHDPLIFSSSSHVPSISGSITTGSINYSSREDVPLELPKHVTDVTTDKPWTKEDVHVQKAILDSIRTSNEEVKIRTREQNIDDEMEKIRTNYELDKQRLMYESRYADFDLRDEYDDDYDTDLVDVETSEEFSDQTLGDPEKI